MTTRTMFRRAQPIAYAALILGLVGAGHAMGQALVLDADGDGMVSYDEAQTALPDLTEAEFAALDANGDGMLNAEEIAAAADAGLIPAG
ncbi:hypothetical protein [Roseicyclus marinus]|uniref:hypothetical protein n=1 Tax=Roseicyclus marinus TaxID=2161673 RepID=UPI00240FF8A2|nr:hypothetical protein [Roseicyclus marinus]MDG3042807.1 hypothetical protein [Roseicyclus marinus]